jgi:hypothetical protein
MAPLVWQYYYLLSRLMLNLCLYRPMSQISAIFGTDDDQEILTSLYLIANVSENLYSDNQVLIFI